MFSDSAHIFRLGFAIGDQDCTKNASPQSEKFANLRITNLLIYPDLELEIGLAQRMHLLALRKAQLFTFFRDMYILGYRICQKQL